MFVSVGERQDDGSERGFACVNGIPFTISEAYPESGWFLRLSKNRWIISSQTTGFRLGESFDSVVDEEIHEIIDKAKTITKRELKKAIKDKGLDYVKQEIEELKMPLYYQCWSVRSERYVVKLTSRHGRADKEFRSFMAHSSSRLSYRLNEWTTHKKDCGAIATFGTVEHALQFLRNQGGYDGAYNALLICEYKKSRQNKLFYSYWQHGFKHIQQSACSLPEGTVFASAVKPVAYIPFTFWENREFPYVNTGARDGYFEEFITVKMLCDGVVVKSIKNQTEAE